MDQLGVGATAQVIHLKRIENLHHKKFPCIDFLVLAKMTLNTGAIESLFGYMYLLYFHFVFVDLCHPQTQTGPLSSVAP